MKEKNKQLINMQRALIRAIFIAMLNCIVLHAIGGTITYEKANQLYHNQQYAEAQELYMQMITEGVTNSSVYCNAGNTFYKQKKFGHALWCYRKAMLIAPTNIIYRENYELTIKKIPKTKFGTPVIPGLQWLKRSLFWHSHNAWALGAILFFTLYCTIGIARKYRNIPAFFIAVRKLCAVLFFVYFAGTVGQLLFYKFFSYGIITRNTALSSTATVQQNAELDNVEGVQVQLLNYVKGTVLSGGMYYIKMPNGYKAYVDASSIEKL